MTNNIKMAILNEENFEDLISTLSPERRLLATILQRAIIDFLSLRNKEDVVMQVRSGGYDVLDTEDLPDKYQGERARAREDRNLIRWFLSESRHYFSFLYIIEELNLEHVRDDIFVMLSIDNIRTMQEFATLQI